MLNREELLISVKVTYRNKEGRETEGPEKEGKRCDLGRRVVIGCG